MTADLLYALHDQECVIVGGCTYLDRFEALQAFPDRPTAPLWDGAYVAYPVAYPVLSQEEPFQPSIRKF